MTILTTRSTAQPKRRRSRHSVSNTSLTLRSHFPTLKDSALFRETQLMFGSSPLVAPITLGIYTVLLGVGGLIGYLKAGSRASLIAGSISALVAVAALALSIAYKNW